MEVLRTQARRKAFDADNTACLVMLDVPPYELKSTFFAIPRRTHLTSEDIEVLAKPFAGCAVVIDFNPNSELSHVPCEELREAPTADVRR